MNFRKRKHTPADWLTAGAAFYAAAQILLRPHTAAEGVWRGLELCYRSVIPALFPFLVLSRLLLDSRAAAAFGLVLRPYTRLLSIRSKKAPAALLCGIFGGFACGAKAVDSQYRAGELSRRDAALLLVCGIGSGPGFVVGSVGGLMLKSTGAGWLLFASQLGASLLCGILAALAGDVRLRRRAVACMTVPTRQTAPASPAAPQGGFVGAVRDAVNATVMLCGYVTLFSFLAAIAVPDGAGALSRFWATLPLEITGACRAACESGSGLRTQLCCAALSAMGASVFFQVRALVSPDISMLPLLFLRLVHLPLALLLLHLLTAFFPGASAVGLSLDAGILPAVRMPCDAMLALFLLTAVVCHGAPSLQMRKKRI